ncbi:hypothetical protein PHLGIDRAFT_457951 [Phlebiopsis gigantea 11061_1 CR5-6]|uniref:Mid2 domain-containing protein n=1 Tax=Phlebiopsis gigantea (strain 11061_1 CR5-6) TaxID=745531 RepID=A0A0C3P1C0_PHLG1|nr:hypothetical protein PHLGIDRAFT_457951 [Phlebiopsis gigantea 11061_1 CR5-6]
MRGISFNSRHQSPCTIAGYLLGACLTDPGRGIIEALPSEDPGSWWYILTADTDCQCNTVFYSMISECSVCQGDLVRPWSQWIANCTNSTFVMSFPRPIPSGTAIPAWAFLNVTMTDTFDPATAQLYQASNSTESSAPPASSTSSVLSSNTQTSTSTGTASSTASPKTNVGAIAGGVVGGVVGVAVLCVLLGLWLKQRKARMSASVHMPEYQTVPVMPQSSSGMGKIYNPDDPSTYPGAIVQTPTSKYDAGKYVEYPPSKMRYNGVAEI